MRKVICLLLLIFVFGCVPEEAEKSLYKTEKFLNNIDDEYESVYVEFNLPFEIEGVSHLNKTFIWSIYDSLNLTENETSFEVVHFNYAVHFPSTFSLFYYDLGKMRVESVSEEKLETFVKMNNGIMAYSYAKCFKFSSKDVDAVLILQGNSWGTGVEHQYNYLIFNEGISTYLIGEELGGSGSLFETFKESKSEEIDCSLI